MVKSSLLAVLITLIIGAAFLWIVPAWMNSDSIYVDLDKTMERAPAGSGTKDREDTFRFAVATIWSPEETFLRYHRMGVRLGQLMNTKETFIIRPSYKEVREDLEAGRVDTAMVCTGTLLHISRDHLVEVLAVPRFEESWDYQGLIVVHKDSAIRTLQDLEGKVMAFTDPESFTGCIVPCSTLLTVTKHLKEFLANVVFTGSHDRAVEAVSSRLVDSAAVNSLIYHAMVEERPEIRDNTRILWQSITYGPPHVLVPTGLSASMKEKLRSALYSFHEDPEGREILGDLGIRKFEEPEPGSYESAKALFERFLSAGGCPWR